MFALPLPIAPILFATLLSGGQSDPDRVRGVGAAPSAGLSRANFILVEPPPKPSTITACDTCPAMIAVPGGSFTMGSDSGEASERPAREVAVEPFRLAETEVTVAQFRAFVTATGHRVPAGCHVWSPDGRMRANRAAHWEAPGAPTTDLMPVSCVSHRDALDYVAWLNSVSEGGGYRLPSEAEFEYALRAGGDTDYPWGPVPDGACLAANGADAGSRFRWRNMDCDDGVPDVAEAGRFPANRFGLHDLSGNLWEWTADCWTPSHRGAPSDAAPRLTGQCESRVLRGGSWDDPIANLRSAYRVGIPAGSRQSNVGFRVALDERP